ncbi:MAG TPA: Rossmann-like and DUF2520 domain-containing protein [Flavobacterium sp.]|jgi:predicted short-subunit dehydrogenase-like oxidoreductase (DUF2520 family)
MIKVSVIGSGNVAQHLIAAFAKSTNVVIHQVYSRQTATLAHLLHHDKITNDYNALAAADVYIIAVSDNAIAEVAARLPFQGQLIVHTSGAMPMAILDSRNRKGVFYPLQSFTKNKEVPFNDIPVCLEAENKSDLHLLEQVARAVSKKVFFISSHQRKSLHVAAVFVNNFVNYLYSIGHSICNENQVPFEILYPLIKETAAKITAVTPEDAQTGPAKRNDHQTIAAHLEFLEDENQKKIYQLLTQSIQHHGKKL